jgi:superfamily II DNA or RNA helicase
VYAPSVPDLTGVKTKRDQFGDIDYVETDLSKRVNTSALVGDIVKHWFKLTPNTPTVVFACDIAHSKHIVEQFCAAGVRAEHIDAYCDHDERKAILKRVDSGETTIISCAALLAEGWDQPSIRTMILARPTRSLIRYVQMAGRILRPFPGKDRAVLLDHSGTALRLGFPTDDRDYTLDDGKPRDTAAKKEEEKKRDLKPCPACGHLDPNGRVPCVACGHKWQRPSKEREVQDGELGLVKRAKATTEQKQRFYSELMTIAQERGRKPGWVSHKYREKFGVWPKGLHDVTVTPSPETRSWVKYTDIRYAKGKAKGEIRA